MRVPGRVWLMILMVIIGILPMASVLVAGWIADLAACPLHEGFAQPCLVMGQDIGGLLHTMTVLGWLMLVSLLVLAGGVLGLVTEALKWALRRIRG